MSDTWCVRTYDGFVCDNAEWVGYNNRVQEKFGNRVLLSDGDTVSVSLCGDRSVSISHNNTEVTQVFTDLPHTPLWVVIDITVYSIEAIPTGKQNHYLW